MKIMKKFFLFGLKLTITIGILTYIFSHIPFSKVMESLTSVKLILVLFAFLIVLIRSYIRASQMKRFTDMQGLSLSKRQIFEINMATSFYGLFLPGYLAGGVIRLYKFSKPQKKFVEAVTSIAYNRLIELMVLVSLGTFFWTLNNTSGVNHCSIELVLWIALAGLMFLYLSVFNRKVSSFVQKILRRIKLDFLPRMFRDKIKKLLLSGRKFHDVSSGFLIKTVSFSLLGHLLGAFSFQLFLMSLGIYIAFISVVAIWSMLILITMLPISISGLGVREGILIFFLKPYGVSGPDAVALSFLLYIRTLFLGSVGMFLELKNFFLPKQAKPSDPTKE